MTNYLIKAGNTLSGIAKQFGVTVKQLQEANGIKNANLIFAGQTLQIPDGKEAVDFNIKGAMLEHTEDTSTVSPSNEDTTVVTPEQSSTSSFGGTKNTIASTPLVESANIGPAFTEDDVLKELADLAELQHGPSCPRVKPVRGETNEHLDYWRSTVEKETEMVCRDASGKTQDISGKFDIVGKDNYEINPEAFTITDKSSGSNHKYLFRKIGITADGKLIYKCVSMNERKISTDNQYTLVWDANGTPELVQFDDHDNYGSGLKF